MQRQIVLLQYVNNVVAKKHDFALIVCTYKKVNKYVDNFFFSYSINLVARWYIRSGIFVVCHNSDDLFR